MKSKLLILAGVAALATAGAALAAVTIDANGYGFVGKGDVQLALGLNNAQVQAITPVFTVASTVVSETTWLCTNTNNQNVQERARTTTTSVQGVVSSEARVKNQVTGYNLNGFAGGGAVTSTETQGPHLNSCPTNWVLTPGSTTTDESSSSVLYVNGEPLQ